MINKKHDGISVISYLTEYLLMSLDELTCIPHRSEFFEGEIIAFVECLEILSDWDSFEKFFKGNVEDKYLVK